MNDADQVQELRSEGDVCVCVCACVCDNLGKLF